MPRPAGLARLWAPWRMPYIQRADEPQGCLFCRVARARDDRRDLVVHRGTRAIVMLNRYPYNPGHLMVAGLTHAASLADLAPAERDALLEAVILAERALASEYRPHGLNLGANLGRVAGAGFPGHVHLHIVPRWNGDTNFMPVVAETKVLPESLARTWSRLRKAMATLDKGAEADRNAARRAAGRPGRRGGEGRGRRG
jgi:ATP adenylyltransferase